LRRTAFLFATFVLCFLVASPAEGGSTHVAGCGVQSYSYAGVQANTTAHGVSATLDPTAPPSVSNGHVGGWIGVGGPGAGPNGTAEWLQAGLAAFPGDSEMEAYYEVALPGAAPKYVELDSSVAAGVSHRFTVLEMAKHKSWWRVWVDGKAVSPPIYLPGSNGAWEPQAIGENWNGEAGACNLYSYRFTNVRLATANGGSWKPLKVNYVFHDPGYTVEPISSVPQTFVAASVNI